MSASKQHKHRDRKRKLRNAQRRIRHRLRDRAWAPQDRPMFRARNIHFEIADKARGLACGGIGMMHTLARAVGLIEAIDRRLHLLKIHLPYHESDHVLNMAYNVLAGGTSTGEKRRQKSPAVVGSGMRGVPSASR